MAGRFPFAPIVAGLTGLLLPLVAIPASWAQQDAAVLDTETAAARDKLRALQRDIARNTDRAQALEDEIAAMGGDRAQLNASLIEAAQRVKLAEIEVGAVEERLRGLATEQTGLRTRLDGANHDVGTILAALQRVGRAPPPALVVSPQDALGSANSAILLAAVLPQLKGRATTIGDDLAALALVQARTAEDEEILRARLTTLFEEQLRIATLIQARKTGVVRAAEALAAEEQLAARLAAEATSLSALIDSLSERIAAVDRAATAAQNATAAANRAASATGNGLDATAIRTALADTSRTTPAFPFAAGKGWLNSPANGVAVTEFGTDDGFGGLAKGVSVVTRADAQVAAPADGWVLYKGPYPGYGQIVILKPDNGHTLLLAGMAELTVELGQFVLLGEPVGRMGDQAGGLAVAADAGARQPTLYIEMRQHNAPIDPVPWWTAADQDS